MECQAGPICSVSSDASSAVRHKVELFYYYEKVSLIRLKLYFFIEVVIMTEIQRKSLITLWHLTFLNTSGPYFQ
jgi:hypothetical protein